MKGVRPALGSLWIISLIKQAPIRKKEKKKEYDRCCKTNQVGTQVGGDDQKDENYIDAAANTREDTSFLVWRKGQMQQLIRERLPRFQFGHKKKQKKKKIQKTEKESSKKQKKEKSKKNRKGKIQKKKNLFSVVLDKICIFCLYPIPDSQ